MPVACGAEVAVIGAGWAGLAAAIHLSLAGRRVRLIDAAPQAGGRARRLTLAWEHPLVGTAPIDLDNGQHLLLGCYTEVLGLLELVGALDDAHLQRRPMRLASSSGLLMERPDFRAPSRRLAPLLGPLLEPLSPLLAVVRAQGIPAASRWAMTRALWQLRLGNWSAPAGVSTVEDWYRQARQPADLIESVWQPLVISALNTPADSACAATFIRILGESLGAGPAASDFILPRRNLSDLFVDPAIDWLGRHGTRLALRGVIRSIERGSARRYRLVGNARGQVDPVDSRHRVDPVDGADSRDPGDPRNRGNSYDSRDSRVMEFDEVVLATPPYASAKLLQGLADAALIAQLEGFRYLPITTAYLGWPRTPTQSVGTRNLALPALLSLRESASRSRFAQWFFDRGPNPRWHVGALVISDSRAALESGDAQLAEALTRQVADELDLPAPARLSLIHEKRATIACTPQRPRLSADAAASRLPGIALAGDYAYAHYPATLEGAVRSGRLAAQSIMAQSKARA